MLENTTRPEPQQADTQMTPEELLRQGADVLEEAHRDGSRAAIEQAQQELRQLQIAAGVVPPMRRTVLRPAQAHRSQSFTGAARRVQLTGGAVSENGGSHRHQRLYR